MDNFHEQLITTSKTAIYKILNILMYVFGVISGVLLGSLNIIPAIFLIAITVGIFFCKRNLFIEFEYNFTNGEIDVDKIVEMKKRTRMLTFNVKDIELLAEENSSFAQEFSKKPLKKINAIPRDFKKNVYVAMITGSGEKINLRFAPDEEFIALCYKYNPRATKK
jgi:hypothetical protein